MRCCGGPCWSWNGSACSRSSRIPRRPRSTWPMPMRRVSGRPGVVAAQSVGTANLAAGLQDAWLGRSPVLALTGHKPIGHQHRNAYQEVAHAPLFAPVTKHAAQVHEAADLPRQFRQAWAAAVAAPPRPVHLDLNGLMGEFVETSETSAAPAALGAWTAPRHRPGADAGVVHAAAAALLSSQRVVIVAGDGAALSGCGAEVLALAEALRAPIATSLGARGMVSTRHPLHVGVVGNYSAPPANRVVHAAELVLFIGCDTGDQVTHTWRVPKPGTRVVQIDADPLEFERSYADRGRAAGRPAGGGGGAAGGARRAGAGWRVPGRGAGHHGRVAHGIRAAPGQRRRCHRPGAALRRDLPRAAGGRHPRRRYRLFRHLDRHAGRARTDADLPARGGLARLGLPGLAGCEMRGAGSQGGLLVGRWCALLPSAGAGDGEAARHRGDAGGEQQFRASARAGRTT